MILDGVRLGKLLLLWLLPKHLAFTSNYFWSERAAQFRTQCTTVILIPKVQRGLFSSDLRDRLSCFLAHYRTTPHTTTGVCPALLGQKPCTRQDLLRPSVSIRVNHKLLQQKHASSWWQSSSAKLFRGVKEFKLGTMVGVQKMGAWTNHRTNGFSVIPGGIEQWNSVPKPPGSDPQTAWSSGYSTHANNGRTTRSGHFSASCHCYTSRAAKFRWTTRRYPARERRPPDRLTYNS